jgi:hypothetical protein
MLFITEDAVIICKHPGGVVQNVPSQDWFTIVKRRVLVEADPEGRTINGCSNFIFGMTKPCVTTLKVTAGYSNLIRIGGKRLCLDTVTGFTDGTPPGTVKYVVSAPGQPLFVQEAS